MARGYTCQLKEILLENGCTLVRHGKADHSIWRSPISGHHFVVDGNIPSRHLANSVPKQTGLKRKID